MSSSSISTSKPADILSRLPNVLFDLTTEWLTPFCTKKLAEQNRRIYSLVREISLKTKHLDLSNSKINDQDLYLALQQHPNYTSINLNHCKNITNLGIQILGVSIRARCITSVSACYVGNDIKPSQEATPSPKTWLKFIHELDFSQLTTLDLSQISLNLSTDELIDSLIDKLKNATQLKILRFGTNSHILRKEKSKEFLLSLPPTINNLQIRAIHLDEELIDIIMNRLDLVNMSECNLNFWDQAVISEAKILSLLRKLPLASMKSIMLAGAALTPTTLIYLATQLAINTNIESLTLIELDENTSMDVIAQLTSSIQFQNLAYLYLFRDGDQERTNNILIRSILIPKLGAATRIKILSVETNQLEELQNKKATLSDASYLFQIEKKSHDPQTKEFISQWIHSLKSIPIHAILAHYAMLHNVINPSLPIIPEQTIEHFNKLSAPPKNLASLHSLELIRRLEFSLKTEEQLITAFERSEQNPLETADQRKTNRSHSYEQTLNHLLQTARGIS